MLYLSYDFLHVHRTSPLFEPNCIPLWPSPPCQLPRGSPYFKGRNFRDFWQNSRKFVPAKYLLSVNCQNLFSRKK